MKSRKIKAVIFDFDGVILDSFLPIFKVHQKMFEIFKKGDFMPIEQFKEIGGTDWKTMYRNLGFTEEELSRLPPVFFEEAMKLSHEFRIFDGMDSIIKNLHKKFRLAIVSNSDRKRIHRHLEKNNLLEYFDFVIGFEAEKYKPDPYQLLECMKELDVKPSETYFVGDTVEDIIAGRAASVSKVVAVAYGYQPSHLLAKADVIANNPSELLKILNGV